MGQPDSFAPIHDLGEGDALHSWRFLVGAEAQVRLLTAMGDVFLIKPHGLLKRSHVFLLDTCSGELLTLEANWEAFKRRVAEPDAEVAAWFKYDLLCDLSAAGKVLQEGQCFSPTIPPFIGGTYEPKNFEPTHWRVHLGISGQIFEQVKDLPPGTPITGISIR